jgi:hypothetical protein
LRCCRGVDIKAIFFRTGPKPASQGRAQDDYISFPQNCLGIYAKLQGQLADGIYSLTDLAANFVVLFVSYLAKYCGKEMQCRALDQKRYFRSRGIVVPEVDVWRMPFCTNMLRAAQVAFQAFSGHCMDRLQTSCNNNLGVVYLATAPGLPQVVYDCPF